MVNGTCRSYRLKIPNKNFLDCKQSLFFLRFIEGSARARVLVSRFARRTTEKRETARRLIKRLELHSAAPRTTLTPLSWSPNSPRAQYLDIRMLTHELIVL